MDPIDELGQMLDAAGAKLTFDSGRSNTHPCTFCGKPGPVTLVALGKYFQGDVITRPVCSQCMPVAEYRSTPAATKMNCPVCEKPHVDEGEFVKKPHRTHRCVDDAAGKGCGHEWRVEDYVRGVL
jgi:hypothetical protein